MVLEKYPDCSLAQGAYLKLGRLNLAKKQWAQAGDYFGMFLNRYPQAKQRRGVIPYLALTYEQQGKPDAAAELYRILGITDPADRRLKAIKARIEKMEGIGK